MFSGIIEYLGTVRDILPGDESCELVVETGAADAVQGESIAVNGVCLTAVRISGTEIRFFVSRETLDRTALGRLRAGDRVNIERAVTPSTRLSGHIVQGHVDGTAAFVSATDAGAARELLFSVPQSLRRYMVEKGSVTIDGISLTLNALRGEAEAETFVISLMIIPHTWEHTTLGTLTPGNPVNIEVDVIAKYVESLCLNR
ncbi:riboflavin synthase [Acetobacter sp. AN02]|uniref:riboflavin synthase n=1 Tax=Acetobacter sp. AN02 TaxID=2894186 RepID=UPI00243432E7|nr:riboflavin synthase [Acetobacter sp. AN02]MDG6093679.1 riboflavin synthase [Acetobacter sp. AN02]